MIHPSSALGRKDRDVAIPERVINTHRLLCRLSLAGQLHILPLTQAAHVLVRSQAWKRFGAVNLSTFARESFELSSWWLRDLTALHESLVEFPELLQSLCGEDGQRPIGRVAARWVGRVATEGNIKEWIALARRLSIHDFRKRVQETLRAPLADKEGNRKEGNRKEGDVKEDKVNGNKGNDGNDKDSGCSRRNLDAEAHGSAEFRVPRFVDLIFHRVEDLHQARTGTIHRADFIESLVGEWRCGEHQILPGGTTCAGCKAHSIQEWDKVPKTRQDPKTRQSKRQRNLGIVCGPPLERN